MEAVLAGYSRSDEQPAPLQSVHKCKKQAQSEHKHSLTVRIQRYVVIATKPVHQLQIRPTVHY